MITAILVFIGLFLATLIVGYVAGVHMTRTSDLIDLFDRRKDDESL